MASNGSEYALASRITIDSDDMEASRISVISDHSNQQSNPAASPAQSETTPSRFTATTVSRFTVHTDLESVSDGSESLSLDIMSVSSEEDLFVEARRAGPSYESFSSESDSDQPNRNYNLELPTCTICLEVIATDSIMTPCSHYFHKACLKPSCNEQEICPNCRHRFSVRWLHLNGIVVLMTAIEFWELFEFSFGPKPGVGPMIPTHQFRDSMSNGDLPRIPGWWTAQWISAKLTELRICFNIPMNIPLSVTDLHQYEHAGIRGRIVDWAAQFDNYHNPEAE